MLLTQPVEIDQADGTALAGDLVLPQDVIGLVLFAHGSGSSRHSPRNRAVAEHLVRRGLGTLLFDLLTAPEESAERHTGHLRFDIELLTQRLMGATSWVAREPATAGLPVGYFGASTGAAAALVAAARGPERVRAVVSRGGRPDLAGAWLAHVQAPTLLIVGGHDAVVVELNRKAYDQLRGVRGLEVVDGATHLFEEPGALTQVATLAASWFERHLSDRGDET